MLVESSVHELPKDGWPSSIPDGFQYRGWAERPEPTPEPESLIREGIVLQSLSSTCHAFTSSRRPILFDNPTSLLNLLAGVCHLYQGACQQLTLKVKKKRRVFSLHSVHRKPGNDVPEYRAHPRSLRLWIPIL